MDSKLEGIKWINGRRSKYPNIPENDEKWFSSTILKSSISGSQKDNSYLKTIFSGFVNSKRFIGAAFEFILFSVFELWILLLSKFAF